MDFHKNGSALPDWRDTERALVGGLRRRETRLSARAKARWLAAGSFYVKGPDLVRFLKHLLTHIPGDILFIWDGLPAHRSQPVKDFLATPAANRLTLLQLPAYAPDLNPQEGIWRYLKYVELANVRSHDLPQLRLALRHAIQRIRSHLDVLFGCLRQVHYSVANSITG